MKKLLVFIVLGLAFLYGGICAEETGNNHTKVYRGHYIYGHEVSSFRACHKKTVYWVTGTIKILQQIQNEYAKYGKDPYEEVFSEFQGRLIGKATDGFASDYDDQLKVEKIITIKKKTDKDCP